MALEVPLRSVPKLQFSLVDDIEVRFYEDDENGWQAFGDFSPTDVHKQVPRGLGPGLGAHLAKGLWYLTSSFFPVCHCVPDTSLSQDEN